MRTKRQDLREKPFLLEGKKPREQRQDRSTINKMSTKFMSQSQVLNKLKDWWMMIIFKSNQIPIAHIFILHQKIWTSNKICLCFFISFLIFFLGSSSFYTNLQDLHVSYLILLGNLQQLFEPLGCAAGDRNGPINLGLKIIISGSNEQFLKRWRR